ncbi:MAG TPA: recombinase family protein [Pseudolabrys sp.]|nr:recombinase family protein [Pseudolabrys sp.]
MGQSRCAIYTRKSTEEGLEQDFNSLDAQREACAAFIQSQKQEGWTAIPKTYDDGGYSGGSMERPALKQVLADIEAKRVDVIVVYKVDRLTRSLSDFAKLVEIFDRCGVSFVSVTQQFNTTTSMGRLTLNILLSFAQFERELIGERVRDKVAASKKKGMWMGGTVPLGYDVKDRKLAVNKAEAKTVVEIYQRYLKLQSVRALRDDLAAAGIRSKRRFRADGSEYGHQKLSQGALYLMLQNRTYRGEATHKGKAYPGEHKAIVDEALWSSVQALLAQNRVARTNGANAQEPSLLTGLLFDEHGERLTPTWTSKKGKRYRYYVSAALVAGTNETKQRIPAGNLEDVVVEKIRRFFSDPKELIDVFERLGLSRQRSAAIKCAARIARQLNEKDQTRTTLILPLLRRVVVGSEEIKIEMHNDRLAALLHGKVAESLSEQSLESKDSGDAIILTVSAQLQRVAREMKLVIDQTKAGAMCDMALLRIIARAYDVQARLNANRNLSVKEVSQVENVSSAYIYSLLRLRWLAPSIVSAIVNGRHPKRLNAKRLMRLSFRLSPYWSEQRALLGFD